MPRGGIARHAAASLRCVAAATALAALAACGATSGATDTGRATASSHAPAPPVSSDARAASSAPGAPVVRRPATGTPAAGPATRDAATAAAAAPPSDPPLPSGLPSSAPLRVRLGAGCVTPGGEQSIVVETLPDAFVAFDNLYPDGRTGAAHGGAEPGARTGADGRFTAVWRVAPGAPAGRVRVDVGVSAKDGSAITMTYYRLAARC